MKSNENIDSGGRYIQILWREGALIYSIYGGGLWPEEKNYEGKEVPMNSNYGREGVKKNKHIPLLFNGIALKQRVFLLSYHQYLPNCLHKQINDFWMRKI